MRPKRKNVQFLPHCSRRGRAAALVTTAVLTVWPFGPGPVRAQGQPARPGQLPILPLTALDERPLAAELDNRTFSLTFPQQVTVGELLMTLVRGTSLSMIPDPSIGGLFIGDLKNVTVRQALNLVLPPLGLDYAVDGSFIRVFRRLPETRLFDLNYIATERAAKSSVGGGSASGSFANVTTSTATDVFADITKGVQGLLSERATFNVDRKAGLLQVTDFPERLDRIGVYLDAVHDRVRRQVEVEAKVLEVELNDSNVQSLDLAALARGSSTGTNASASRRMVSGLGPGDVTRFLEALAEQGKVSTLADPRIWTLNNEPAIVRTSQGSPDAGMTLAVTPQIADDGVITLALSPIVSTRVPDQNNSKTPPSLSIRETDTVARLADGATLVLAGFTRERETRERQPNGIKGGWFGRSTVVVKKRIELVILLTPRMLETVGTP